MIRLGVTGVIGSGKSQVARRLRELGIPTIESDDIVHEVYRPGTALNRRLAEVFGSEILDPAGAIDRKALAAIVFADPAQRRRLESLTWPEVRKVTDEWLEQQERAGAAIAAVITPLLFEAGRETEFDYLWLIEAPEETLIDRLSARGLSPEQSRARLCAQWSQERRLDAARTCGKPYARIVNDSDIETLDKRVTAALDRL